MLAPSAAAAATTSATGIPRPMPEGSPSGPILLRYAAASREKGARMPDVPLTWLGHASFRLDTPAGKRIYVDPFLSGNPKCPDFEQEPERIDVIALTHGHGDHVGDTVELSKKFENGTTIYFAGDTCVFGDMQLIGRIYAPDVAVLPIGGHFTMDPREAGVACELLGARRVVPCHYGTFPLLAGTPEELRQHAPGVEIEAIAPGESLTP